MCFDFFRQKIRKTLSDPSTIEQDVQNWGTSVKQRNKILAKRNRKIQSNGFKGAGFESKIKSSNFSSTNKSK